MRVCFFSDIHGNYEALRGFFESVEFQEIDLMVFGGDFFGYYYSVNETITELREREVLCLLGNHDKMFIELLEGKQLEDELCTKYGNAYRQIVSKISRENVDFLYSLKSEYQLYVDGLRLKFVHGSIDDPVSGRIYPDTIITNPECYEEWDIVFMGHTHHKMTRRVGSCMLVNPGSAGQQRDGKGTSYIIFDTVNRQCSFYIFQYDINKLMDEIDAADEIELMNRKLKEVLVRKNVEIKLKGE